ncbi:Subtilisin serine protease, partial [Globisporangium splendens]
MVHLRSLLTFASVVATALLAPSTEAASTKAKSTTKNVIITMQERTESVLEDLKTQKFASRGKRAQAMKDGLEKLARKSQQDVFTILEKSGIAYTRSESFWLTNQIFVQGAPQKLIDRIAELPSVLSVEPEQVFPLVFPTLETVTTSATTVVAQWGVNKIRAPDVWATGNTGKGVVVGIIDTGACYTQKDIADNWRQSFGWYDPETKAALPYDATGHGTHVTEIVAGANGIGVAPGVTWIMCKGCRSSGCCASDLLACFQFMACPTTPDGLTKDCSKHPHVVNNSWGAGQGVSIFDSVINTWHANQITPIFAAGNSGPSCTTVMSPGDKSNVITVGATDTYDYLASFSSKGPSVAGLRKPDVLAPGAAIRSSCHTGDADCCVKSGTSMASPHVAGMVALYLSRFPAPTLTTTATENSAPHVDAVAALRSTAQTSVPTKATGLAMAAWMQRNYSRMYQSTASHRRRRKLEANLDYVANDIGVHNFGVPENASAMVALALGVAYDRCWILQLWRYYGIGMATKWYKTIALLQGLVAIPHGLEILRMLGASLFHRSLAFAFSSQPQLQSTRSMRTPKMKPTSYKKVSPGMPSASVLSSSRRGYFSIAARWKLPYPVCAMKSYYFFFARDGFFGVEGRHFHLILFCRELVETSLQTIQAYRMSFYLPRVWLNRFFVSLLVLNCWLTPLIHHVYKHHEAKKRLLCLVCDCVLDLVASVVIPCAIIVTYEGAYDRKLGGFDIMLWYDDVWFIHVIHEFQMLLVVSWQDLSTRLVFSLGMLSAMLDIKDLLMVSALSARRLTAIAPEAPVLKGPKGSDAAARSAPTIEDIRATGLRLSSMQKRLRTASVVLTNPKVRRHVARCVHFAVALWGAVILGLHVY